MSIEEKSSSMSDGTQLTRREIFSGVRKIGLFMVAGNLVSLSPADAKIAGFEPQVLSSTQISALENICDALAPGAKAAGIGAYLDSQLFLGKDSLLIAKYLGVDTTMQRDFYTKAADNIIKIGNSGVDVETIAAHMASDSLKDWTGPPASYVFFILRADALDVTYGTPEGFKKLGIPYMAQIKPDKPW